MKKVFEEYRWAIECIGIASIVASLIFVGLELQQARDISLNERTYSRVDADIGLTSAINEHPEIWAKGNRGDNLSESERVVYENLIRLMWNHTNALARTGERSGSPPERNPSVINFSWFLFENPGARQTWTAFGRDEDLYSTILSGIPSSQRSISELINENLRKLDSEITN